MHESPPPPYPTATRPHTSLKKIAAQLRAADSWIESNPQHAYILALEAVRQIGDQNNTSLPHRRLRGQALILAGRASLITDTPERAIPSFLQALTCYNPASDLPEIIPAHTGLGVGYMDLGVYPEALQHLMRALTISRNLKDQRGQVISLNHLGRLYHLHGELPKAFTHLEQALERIKDLPDDRLEADILLNLCNACRATNQLPRAIQAGLRAVEIYQQHKYRPGEARALNALGEAYLEAEEYQHALDILQLTAEAAERNSQRLELSRALRKIGILHARQERNEWGQKYLTRALEIATEINAQREQAECYFELAGIHKVAGDYRLALEHLENYHTLNRAAFDSESDRRLKNIEIIHQVETARKDAEIYQLRNVQLQQEIEERKKAQAALEHLATQDSLTGLANRRHFLDMAQRAFTLAGRYQRPLTAIMIDIDHFKLINDTFGHKTGDQVLVSVAACMQEVLRKVDILGRFGGDEFVFLLPETTQEGAVQLADRLRTCVNQRSQLIGGLSLQVTLSIGIATHTNDPDLNLDTLLQQADKAMYLSKQAGRDRVTIYPL
jgi:diguanylate cyclase (GGDEF)-like protein